MMKHLSILFLLHHYFFILLKPIFLMTQKLSEEFIKKIRQEVRRGKPKLQVAKELGLHYETVKKYTRDLPSRKVYSFEEKEKIKQMVREIGVKSIVARKLGIPYNTVLRITQDIKFGPGNNTIGGKTFHLLEEIMNNGYALLEGNVTPNFRILKKHFPVIQRVHAKGKTIAFLPDKKEKAVKVLLQNLRWRVMSYQELKGITKLFGVELSSSEKQKFLGRSEQRKKPKIQQTLDDFYLGNDDSLAFFGIRRY